MIAGLPVTMAKPQSPPYNIIRRRRVPGPNELGLAVRCCGWQPTRDPPPVPKRACQGRNAEIINLDILNEILRNVLYRAIKKT